MTKVEKNRRQKSEDKQVKKNEDKFRGLESCESWVSSILTFDSDHIKTLKVKELRVLLCYQFGSERFKGTSKKMELVEAVNGLSKSNWEGLMQKVGGGGLVVMNEIVEIEIFLV